MAQINHKPRYLVTGEVNDLPKGTEVIAIGMKCFYSDESGEPPLKLTRKEYIPDYLNELFKDDEEAMDCSWVSWTFTVVTRDGRTFSGVPDTELTPLYGVNKV
jgi:hypothetical protein